MRLTIPLRWSARVLAALPAALLSMPMTAALADEPFPPVVSPDEVFQSTDAGEVERLAVAGSALTPEMIDVSHQAQTPCGQPGCPICNPAPKKKAPPVFPGPKLLPPTGPYKPLYFDNDYSYKKDPNHEYIFGEELKDMQFPVGDQCFTVSTGGEVRHRYMNEDNRLRPGGPIDVDYNLWRWRHFVDVKAGKYVRAYVEGIHADSFGNEAPDQLIDVNRWDIQNAFLDIQFLEDDYGTHNLRVGRQEMLFGRQRLVSPLDWANTRRNFEGLRYWHKGENHRLDLFSVNPVNTATLYNTIAVNDNRFDRRVSAVNFSGAYFTYSGFENTSIEPYWFYLDTRDDIPSRPDGARHLFGTRIAHLRPVSECGEVVRTWDFDAEGGFQVGKDNGQDVDAGFLTAVVGHTWNKAMWTPRVSGLFYYGSGDKSPTDTQNNTFNTLWPLGHAYWAISDNVAGQNLYDYSLRVDVKPTKKTGAVADMHWFELASAGDRAYNLAGAPVGTPGNGRNLGQAFDLYGYYAFNPNFDISAGYSLFWYGTFIDKTAPRGDAEQLYIQTSFRY